MAPTMPNPQPQPDAEGRLSQIIADAYEAQKRGMQHTLITADVDTLEIALASLATLRGERDALRADKARLDILQDWLRGADYAYGELGEDQVLVFDLPAIRVSCDLRKTLDDARAAHQGTEP